MFAWVEPLIWWLLDKLSYLMQLVGVTVLLAAFCLLIHRGTEALIKKGERIYENQD